MEDKQIPAYLVNGFLDAGKTTYIQECLKNDFFCKRGKTLLVLFEDGEGEYDMAMLEEKNTVPVFYPGEGDIRSFLLEEIEKNQPDRLYIEMNATMPDLRESLPECLKIKFSITLIDGSTLPLYYLNMRQLLQNMISETHQVIFSRCTLDDLKAYGNIFRVMNQKASYLWEGPTGYHEKAFGVMVPYDLAAEHLVFSDSDYTPFYLDAISAPQHYTGKTVEFLAKLENDLYDHSLKAGRVVMTCCAADLQYLGFPLRNCDSPTGTWISLRAECVMGRDSYGSPRLELKCLAAEPASPPSSLAIGL